MQRVFFHNAQQRLTPQFRCGSCPKAVERQSGLLSAVCTRQNLQPLEDGLERKRIHPRKAARHCTAQKRSQRPKSFSLLSCSSTFPTWCIPPSGCWNPRKWLTTCTPLLNTTTVFIRSALSSKQNLTQPTPGSYSLWLRGRCCRTGSGFWA